MAVEMSIDKNLLRRVFASRVEGTMEEEKRR
jgi:hypothetical protein